MWVGGASNRLRVEVLCGGIWIRLVAFLKGTYGILVVNPLEKLGDEWLSAKLDSRNTANFQTRHSHVLKNPKSGTIKLTSSSCWKIGLRDLWTNSKSNFLRYHNKMLSFIRQQLYRS